MTDTVLNELKTAITLIAQNNGVTVEELEERFFDDVNFRRDVDGVDKFFTAQRLKCSDTEKFVRILHTCAGPKYGAAVMSDAMRKAREAKIFVNPII